MKEKLLAVVGIASALAASARIGRHLSIEHVTTIACPARVTV